MNNYDYDDNNKKEEEEEAHLCGSHGLSAGRA